MKMSIKTCILSRELEECMRGYRMWVGDVVYPREAKKEACAGIWRWKVLVYTLMKTLYLYNGHNFGYVIY